MATFLLTWNPQRWSWDDLQDYVQAVQGKKLPKVRWSCGNNQRIQKGDRLFLIRLGREPRGIFASGWAVTDVFRDEHWNKNAARPYAWNIEMKLDALLDPEHELILSRTQLNEGVLAKMHWDSQVSGVTIPEEVAEELEKVWVQFLDQTEIIQPIDRIYFEGTPKQISSNNYERNPQAREQCIEYYGVNCSVCGFNFEKVYGAVGKDFIHVHHLVPLSEIGHKYELDPIHDLRPVCANCHAIIHRRTPAYTIDDVKAMLLRAASHHDA